MFDEFDELYQKMILDRSAHPLHAKRLAIFDATAKGDNPMCGDRVQVWVHRRADGRVDEAGFEARGCRLSVASADLMADAVVGADLGEIRALYAGFADLVSTGACPACSGEVAEKLDVLRPLAGVHSFPSRVRCTTLPWSALIAALEGKEASSE